jgi:hypothetical protein
MLFHADLDLEQDQADWEEHDLLPDPLSSVAPSSIPSTPV